MKKNHIFGIIGVVIVAVIVLALVLPEKQNKETADIDLQTFEAPQTHVGEGEFVYNFDGIAWDLEAIEAGSARVPETKVGFFFDNFTRYEEGIAVAFGSPYHLGFYKGDCVALETLPADNELLDSIEGNLIAGLACLWEDQASMVVLAQNANIITAYDVKAADSQALNTVRTIDITTIVE